MVGILEEAAGLARGCAPGGASSHIPARGLPRVPEQWGGTCCATGMSCRDVPQGHSGVPSCDTGHAKEQVGQEQLKTLRAMGRRERW